MKNNKITFKKRLDERLAFFLWIYICLGFTIFEIKLSRKKIMKTILLSIALLIISLISHATQFITRWDLSKPGTNDSTISFGVGTTGTVNYTWETVPAGTSGTGSFSGTSATIIGLPPLSIIRLKIDSANFNQIICNQNNNNSRLLDVEQ
jgi:hypothetical protein